MTKHLLFVGIDNYVSCVKFMVVSARAKRIYAKNRNLIMSPPIVYHSLKTALEVLNDDEVSFKVELLKIINVIINLKHYHNDYALRNY